MTALGNAVLVRQLGVGPHLRRRCLRVGRQVEVGELLVAHQVRRVGDDYATQTGKQLGRKQQEHDRKKVDGDRDPDGFAAMRALWAWFRLQNSVGTETVPRS